MPWAFCGRCRLDQRVLTVDCPPACAAIPSEMTALGLLIGPHMGAAGWAWQARLARLLLPLSLGRPLARRPAAGAP